MALKKSDHAEIANEGVGVTRRCRGLIIAMGATVALMQSGCAATIGKLLANKPVLTEPIQPPPSKPPVKPATPKPEISRQKTLSTPEEMNELEDACDALVTSSARKIASTDFRSIGKLFKRINVELTEFRSNPTKFQKSILALSYAEYYEMKIENLKAAIKQLEMAAQGYAYVLYVIRRWPETQTIIIRTQRLEVEIKRIEQIDMNVVRELEEAQIQALPPWDEIEKIPVDDPSYMEPPPDFLPARQHPQPWQPTDEEIYNP